MIQAANKALVLVVDDDTEVAEFLKTSLEINNYNPHVVHSGDDALAYVKTQLPDLILLDLTLPGKSGIDVCRILKSNNETRDIPVIILTSNTDTRVIAQCYELGADEFMNKPFEPIIFLAQINSLLKIRSTQKLLIELNKQVNSTVTEKNREMSNVYFQTIKYLADAVDAKDQYTRSHSLKVAQYSLDIAKSMGLNEIESEKIYHAAELHDLGKIKISESIFEKKGKLTEGEWEQIKSHPQITAEILEPIFSMEGILDMIRMHHEHYDGSGYPTGAKAGQIPVGARIIAVADAYDAMTCDRPYRRALSKKQAILELEKNSGKQFDPEIIKTFVSILKKTNNF